MPPVTPSGHPPTDARQAQQGPLEVLHELAIAAAVEYGLAQPEAFADDLVRRFCSELGGCQVYIPSERSLRGKKAAQAIGARFNGRNAHALAQEFGYTLRHVQRIVAKRPAPSPPRQQPRPTHAIGSGEPLR